MAYVNVCLSWKQKNKLFYLIFLSIVVLSGKVQASYHVRFITECFEPLRLGYNVGVKQNTLGLTDKNETRIVSSRREIFSVSSRAFSWLDSNIIATSIESLVPKSKQFVALEEFEETITDHRSSILSDLAQAVPIVNKPVILGRISAGYSEFIGVEEFEETITNQKSVILSDSTQAVSIVNKPVTLGRASSGYSEFVTLDNLEKYLPNQTPLLILDKSTEKNLFLRDENILTSSSVINEDFSIISTDSEIYSTCKPKRFTTSKQRESNHKLIKNMYRLGSKILKISRDLILPKNKFLNNKRSTVLDRGRNAEIQVTGVIDALFSLDDVWENTTKIWDNLGDYQLISDEKNKEMAVTLTGNSNKGIIFNKTQLNTPDDINEQEPTFSLDQLVVLEGNNQAEVLHGLNQFVELDDISEQESTVSLDQLVALEEINQEKPVFSRDQLAVLEGNNQAEVLYGLNQFVELDDISEQESTFSLDQLVALEEINQEKPVFSRDQLVILEGNNQAEVLYGLNQFVELDDISQQESTFSLDQLVALEEINQEKPVFSRDQLVVLEGNNQAEVLYGLSQFVELDDVSEEEPILSLNQLVTLDKFNNNLFLNNKKVVENSQEFNKHGSIVLWEKDASSNIPKALFEQRSQLNCRDTKIFYTEPLGGELVAVDKGANLLLIDKNLNINQPLFLGNLDMGRNLVDVLIIDTMVLGTDVQLGEQLNGLDSRFSYDKHLGGELVSLDRGTNLLLIDNNSSINIPVLLGKVDVSRNFVDTELISTIMLSTDVEPKNITILQGKLDNSLLRSEKKNRKIEVVANKGESMEKDLIAGENIGSKKNSLYDLYYIENKDGVYVVLAALRAGKSLTHDLAEGAIKDNFSTKNNADKKGREINVFSTSPWYVIAQEINRLLLSKTSPESGDKTKYLWGDFFYTHAHQLAKGSNLGFTANIRGFILGGETKLGTNGRLGIGHLFHNVTVDSTICHFTTTSGYTAFMYGYYQAKDWYLQGLMSYGYTGYSATVAPTQGLYDNHTQTIGSNLISGFRFKAGLTTELGLRYLHLKQASCISSEGEYMGSICNGGLSSIWGINYSPSFTLDKILKPSFYVRGSYSLANGSHNSILKKAGDKFVILPRLGLETGVSLRLQIKNCELSIGYDLGYGSGYASHTGKFQVKYSLW